MKDRILAEIRETGPIPFERFMDLALYDPGGGFFAGSTLRSEKAGDFLTSPEVSPAFGATLGRFVQREYERLGRPDDFTVLEVGAGSGSLLEPLLDSLGFTPTVRAVEASPAARAALAERFPGIELLEPDTPLPAMPSGVVVANELLDNLPMALAVRTGSDWTERWVAADGDSLGLAAVAVRDDVRAWLNAWSGPVPEGGIVEVQLAAAAWIESVSAALGQGSIVAIDYGDTAELLEPRRASGTLRTYRAHHLGPHPLDEPGATDITADVNFTALLGLGERLDLACSLVRQDDFLRDHGLREHLADLRLQELELARGSDTMARLKVRSQVTDIETILHPRGLGDFRVFVAREPSEV